MGELEKEFDVAMLNIYRLALSEAGYNAIRFLQMLHENRGLETARILLHSSNVSDGYIALWERGRLYLTVEALIIDEKWKPLFPEQEREIAWRRLTEYNYKF